MQMCKDMAMRWYPGDNTVFARRARLSRQVTVHVPRRRVEDRAAQRGTRRRSLDGRVEGFLLRDESRFAPNKQTSKKCARASNV